MVDTLFLAVPHGFCAGVSRAVRLVEETLKEYGPPIYVRHEIVHNKHVVEDFQKRGVVFIEDFDEITDTSRPVILSAHGTERHILQEGAQRGLKLIDATCPLVKKVHRQIQKLETEGANIIVIGKKTHPEIIGTVGQINNHGQITIINSEQEAENISLPTDRPVGVVTQTTLSVEQAQKIISILRRRLPNLITADKNDICYATSHRQAAVRELSKHCDAVVVIGSKNSSNSKQLQQTALQNGVTKAWLIDDADELPSDALRGVNHLGISAGASAPEHLVQNLIAKLKEDYANLKIRDIIVAEENIEFKS